MGEMLLELEQYISKAKCLLLELGKYNISKQIIFDKNRIDILLEDYINQLIYLSADTISYQWIDKYNNIKNDVMIIIDSLERGTYND